MPVRKRFAGKRAYCLLHWVISPRARVFYIQDMDQEHIAALETQYLPAEKAPPEEVTAQHELLAADPVVTGTLDAMLSLAVVLNKQRQVVYANKALTDFLRLEGLGDVVGKRVGDLFGCRHACERPGGCGTTESCRKCGAANALASALSGGKAVNECRISAAEIGDDLDLRVRTRPLVLRDREYLLAAFQDISAEKRREALEKIFFHDVVNTAAGVQGILQLMPEVPHHQLPSYISAAARASDTLVDQILSQRDLYAAERGELTLNLSRFGLLALLKNVAGTFSAAAGARGVEIEVRGPAEEIHIISDRTLLSRVAGNLLKNALEAEQRGAVVTMSCRRVAGGAVLEVHNPGRMSESVRLQVFQRSFSTKGAGRGLGTYSIRLLTDKYLKGSVSFATDGSGTTFTARYPAKLEI